MSKEPRYANYRISSTNPQNEPKPPGYGWFEKELLRIGGKAPNGKALLRLEWGQEETIIRGGKLRMKYLALIVHKRLGWQCIDTSLAENDPGRHVRYGAGVRQEDIPAHFFITEIKESFDIGKPRWYIAEYWPAGLCVPDWEEQRYTWKDGIREDTLGPAPHEGMYRSLMVLEDDDKEPIEPCQAVLEEIQVMLRERERTKIDHGAEEGASPVEMERMLHEMDQWDEDRQRKFKNALEDRLEQSMKPFLRRLKTTRPNAGRGHRPTDDKPLIFT